MVCQPQKLSKLIDLSVRGSKAKTFVWDQKRNLRVRHIETTYLKICKTSRGSKNFSLLGEECCIEDICMYMYEHMQLDHVLPKHDTGTRYKKCNALDYII